MCNYVMVTYTTNISQCAPTFMVTNIIISQIKSVNITQSVMLRHFIRGNRTCTLEPLIIKIRRKFTLTDGHVQAYYIYIYVQPIRKTPINCFLWLNVSV